MILKGDCIEEMKKLPDNSVDAIVTDPPYGIGFMGKEWDNFKPSTITEGMAKDKRQKTEIASTRISNIAGTYDNSIKGARTFQKFCEQWSKEALRILKPGGFMLVSCSTRMYHRMTCGIEDAGFEIRDTILWLYGSGFPKSLNIGKQIDKIQGNDREVVESNQTIPDIRADNYSNSQGKERLKANVTKGSSEWEGWGTALKPACEPIVIARKPLSEKNVALNVLKWGTGGINIDACRVEGEERDARENNISWGISRVGQENDIRGNKAIGMTNQGRFPANIILDEEAGELLDDQSGELSQGHIPKIGSVGNDIYGKRNSILSKEQYLGKGGASRFFYCAKASKSERNYGCEDLEEKNFTPLEGGNLKCYSGDSKSIKTRNNHPTVKPIKLMEYLIKLVSKEGATVLDPFLGSGTTALACQKLNRKWIGIEKEEEYIKIAQARIKPFLEQRRLEEKK